MIVGNSEKQVKFSELTLDMFRMLQALEREPEEYQPYTLENSADFTGDQVVGWRTYPYCWGSEHSGTCRNREIFPLQKQLRLGFLL